MDPLENYPGYGRDYRSLHLTRRTPNVLRSAKLNDIAPLTEVDITSTISQFIIFLDRLFEDYAAGSSNPSWSDFEHVIWELRVIIHFLDIVLKQGYGSSSAIETNVSLILDASRLALYEESLVITKDILADLENVHVNDIEKQPRPTTKKPIAWKLEKYKERLARSPLTEKVQFSRSFRPRSDIQSIEVLDQATQRRNPQPLPREPSPTPSTSQQALQDVEMQAYPQTASQLSRILERLDIIASTQTTTTTEPQNSVTAFPTSKCSGSTQSIGILIGTLTLSLTMGTWWFATHGGDMSAASGLVGDIVAMGAMVLVVLQAWHYKHCECWKHSEG